MNKEDSNLASVMSFWRLSLITVPSFPVLFLHPHHLLDNHCLPLGGFFPVLVYLRCCCQKHELLFWILFLTATWTCLSSFHLLLTLFSLFFYPHDATQKKIGFCLYPLFLFLNIPLYYPFCLLFPVLSYMFLTTVSRKEKEI